MDTFRKIISDVEPGERTPARAYLPRLRPYLPSRILVDRLCAACWHGTGQIIALTWKWIRAAAPGDRWIRALAPAGVAAAALYGLKHEPRLVAGGLLLAWLTAAGVLAPRDVWSGPHKSSEEAPAEPPGPSAEQFVERDRRALLALLDQATVRRNGVHLDDLYQSTSAHSLFEGVPRENLTALLTAFGVPVARTLSVDGVSGRTGVRRAAVEQLLQAASPDSAGPDSRDTESGPDQDDSQPLSDGSQRPLGAALGQP